MNRRANRYRPSPVDRPHCGDFPAEFDEDGRILTRMNADDVPQGVRRGESVLGTRDHHSRLRLRCADDGCDVEWNPRNVRNGINNAECGCGPNLVYCAPGQFRTAPKGPWGAPSS